MRAETSAFLKELERTTNRRLNFPDDVGLLLEAARRFSAMKDFENVIFLAKFIDKSVGVMRRIGPDGEGYDKISAEVRDSVRKASVLLQGLSERCGEEVTRSHTVTFYALSHESLERLMRLFSDLAAVKNWVLDDKPLP